MTQNSMTSFMDGPLSSTKMRRFRAHTHDVFFLSMKFGGPPKGGGPDLTLKSSLNIPVVYSGGRKFWMSPSIFPKHKNI